MEVAKTLNRLDWILLGWILFGLLYGYRKGLFGVIVSYTTYVLAFAIAARFSGKLLLWADHRWALISRVNSALQAALPLSAPLTALTAGGPAPDDLTAVLADLPVPDLYRQALFGQVMSGLTAEPSRSVTAVISTTVATGLVSYVSFFLVAVVCIILISLISRPVLRWLDSLPLLGAVNRWFGAALGGAGAILLGAIVFGLIMPFLALPGADGLANIIGASRLLTYFSPLLHGLTRLWLPGS